MRPPARESRSSTTNEAPRFDSSNAVASPAMPPPTIAMSIMKSRLAANQVFEQRDEDRRGVQRRRATQSGAGLARNAGRLDVDVKEDLGVIADEADRYDEEFAAARGRLSSHEIVERGSSPRFRRAAGALK